MPASTSFHTKFAALLNRVGQLILLNFCFLLCCLPLVTVGAASAALYTVCFRFGTPREGHVVTEFFRAFRSALKQGIVMWMILLLLGAFILWCMLWLLLSGGLLRYAFVPFLVVLFVVLTVMGYAFPMLALFENTTRQTLKNAFILGLGNLPRSVLVVAVNAAPFVLPLVSAALFARAAIFLLFLYGACAAWLNTWLLGPVFAPFLPEEKED